MMTIPFLKMHGLGNDFIIIDCRQHLPKPNTETIIAMSNRHRGIGCDQFIVLENAQKEGDVLMRIYNGNDGGQVGACGNVTRCVGRLIMNEMNVPSCNIETIDGVLKASWADKANHIVTIDMGMPKLTWQHIPLSQEMDTLSVNLGIDGLPPALCVSMGNPHAVFFVDDAEAIAVEHYGKMVESHPLFPEKTNVEFVHKVNDTTLRMRVWERSAGITQACGTGACAVTVAGIQAGIIPSDTATVILDGGPLTITWQDKKSVLMTGATTLSFTGHYHNDYLGVNETC